MQKSNAEILHHFYSLLLEMNYYGSEDEIPSPELSADPFIQKHLRAIKLKTAKNRAALNKNVFQSLVDEINRLRQIGADELNKLLSPREAMQIQSLYSKFESFSEKDAASIAEDTELLQLISALKDRLDKAKPK